MRFSSRASQFMGFQEELDSFLFEVTENGLKITTQNAYI
jgi:hypothetical protein